jgi:signal transduction histidine kinase
MDISLLVSGNMQVIKKPTALNYLLTTIYESFVDAFHEKGIDFQLRLNPNISDLKFETDQEILKKIFYHLLDNALKFTKEGTVQFGALQKNNVIEFFVEDTGIGINAEMQKSVFGHFIQADSRTARGYEGAGLGLSIAKGMVELLDGDIKLKSKKGSGTTVTFFMPLP